MYMIAVQGVGGGGGPFMLLSNVLDTNGEGVGTFWKFGYQIQVFCALLSLN